MSRPDEPRRRASSVTISTAELVAERVAGLLRVPVLSAEDREAVAGYLVEWCGHRTRLALEVERRESDRLRRENTALLERLEGCQRELARARNAMRHE